MAGLSSDRGPPRRSRRRFLCYAFILLAISISALTGCSSAAAVPRQRSVVHHHHHHHHQHGQQQQQHRTRCPWPLITDGAVQEGPDVAGTRAYLAPVVFEGKARSKSDGPVYRVTFDVVTVYKGQVGTGTQVRLEFMAGNGTSVVMPATTSTVVQRRTTKNNHHHNHNHHNPSNKECLVSADIRTGRRYMVFAAHWGPNNLTAVSSPLIHTKKSLKEVRSTLCPRCGELLLLLLLLFCLSSFPLTRHICSSDSPTGGRAGGWTDFISGSAPFPPYVYFQQLSFVVVQQRHTHFVCVCVCGAHHFLLCREELPYRHPPLLARGALTLSMF